MKVLFVCLGNICRSPMAHGLLQHKIEKAGLNWQVDSAGTSDWHKGELPDHRAMACMLRHGIDISYQHSRPFVRTDFDKFDLIYVMDKANLSDVMQMTSTDDERNKVKLMMSLVYEETPIDVPDPYFGKGEEGFENVYKILDEATDNLLEQATTS